MSGSPMRLKAMMALAVFMGCLPAWSQETVYDRVDEFRMENNGITIVSNRNRSVINVREILVVSTEDSERQSGYVSFVISGDNVVKLSQRWVPFEQVQKSDQFKGFTAVNDIRNKRRVLLLNRDKIIAVNTEKITEERTLARVSMNGSSAGFEVEGYTADIEAITR